MAKWSPRQKVLRKFLQLHEALDKAFRYVDFIAAEYQGRDDQQDVIDAFVKVKDQIAVLDTVIEYVERRVRTGTWPEMKSEDKPKP